MRKNIWMVLALLIVVPAMLFATSCAKKAVEGASTTEPAMTDDTMDADAAEKARLEAERIRAEEEELARAAAREAFTNDDIYFEFDSASLLPVSQDMLSKKAGYMLAMSAISVTIEGHCDERGTDAYNMALGERRAEAAKAYLVNLGVNPSQIDTISYGEERPVDMGHDEAAWSKNRRAHFSIN
jgi:peptidoglycan-associated lipoprotein